MDPEKEPSIDSIIAQEESRSLNLNPNTSSSNKLSIHTERPHQAPHKFDVFNNNFNNQNKLELFNIDSLDELDEKGMDESSHLVLGISIDDQNQSNFKNEGFNFQH